MAPPGAVPCNNPRLTSYASATCSATCPGDHLPGARGWLQRSAGTAAAAARNASAAA